MITQVIEGVTPSLAQDLAEGLKAAELGLAEDLGTFAGYAREPVPDLYSADPADRTEWFRLHDGYETCFASVLNDHREWEYLIGFPVPVPAGAAPETADIEPGPGTTSGEVAGPPPALKASPDVPVPVTPVAGTAESEGAVNLPVAAPVPSPVVPVTAGEDEPVQDEPAAEADCAEDGGAA